MLCAYKQNRKHWPSQVEHKTVYITQIVGSLPLAKHSPSNNNIYRQRVTHDCASILDSIAKLISFLPQFFTCCIPSLHPHSSKITVTTSLVKRGRGKEGKNTLYGRKNTTKYFPPILFSCTHTRSRKIRLVHETTFGQDDHTHSL